MNVAQEGDLVLLISKDYKNYMITLRAGSRMQTHRGMILHDDLIGQPFGRQVQSHQDYPFLVLEPSTRDLIQQTKRITQIMFPKDIGYLLLRLNIHPGRRVIEAGTSEISGPETAHADRRDRRVTNRDFDTQRVA